MNTMLRRAIVALVALWPVLAPAQNALTQLSLQVNGQARSYYLHVPSALAGRSGLPLMLVFHGGQGTGQDAASITGMAAAADAAGFVVAFPNADGQWNDGRATTADGPDDVAFTMALIAELARSHGADPARVYAVGMSNGGMFAQRLACDHAASFRAYGIVAANLPADYANACRPAAPVAISFYNATTDPIMPWAGGDISSTGAVGEGGTVLSHANTMAFWSQSNACQTLAGPTAWPDAYPRDGTTVQTEGLSNCAGAVTMDIYIITGGGHTWPGSGAGPSLLTGLTSKEVSATNQLVAFFQKYGL
jgi:polyhydroxybutyrate depolymerase